MHYRLKSVHFFDDYNLTPSVVVVPHNIATLELGPFGKITVMSSNHEGIWH